MVGRVVTEDDNSSSIRYVEKDSEETVDLLVNSEICISKSEARRIVHQMPHNKLETLLSTAELKLELQEKEEK